MMQRFLNMIGAGRITLVKDDKDVQRIQVSQGNTGSDDGESLTDDVAMIGVFGVSSNAPEGAELVLVRLGGDRSQTIAVGSNHRPSRPTGLKPGEVKIYDQRGAFIYLSLDGIVIDAADKHVTIKNADTVEIDAPTVIVKASTKVRIESPTVETTGDFVSRADGAPVSLNGLRDAYVAHKHTGGTISGNTGVSDHLV